MNRLAAIGITSVGETGHLVLDSAKLEAALASNLDGVMDLFSTSFATSNSDVTYVASSSRTVLGSSGFVVDIASAATHGTLEGADLGSFPVALTSGNNQIRLKVDGKESSILTLTAQTYDTGEELATEIQARLDADSQLAGRNITVEFTDGHLLFASSSYGSASKVELGSEPANSAFLALGLTDTVAATGLDVAGTINGEAATGKGQILKGNHGNATTDGLSLLVALTSAEVDLSDSEAVVTVIDGIAARLSDQLDFLTDPVEGRITSRVDTFTRKIDELDADIADMEQRLDEKRQDLVEQFARLEAALATMTSQGDFLVQQLSKLPTMNKLGK
jgi:flagellar hook-associated protein 2